ncbi:MAG TPA: 50S ribosomal protein L4, partial [Mycoplasmatales bacterium]|nr:50S ribosomal protein L4 [Mycoplasmatales bacterium]
MEVKVFNCFEKKFSTNSLNSKIWRVSFSPLLISLYNRYSLLNRRNVISKTKNKAEVSGGGRKPWMQKGTGRARQGSIRSPQWVGGGVVFGPSGNQNYSVEMNKKERRKALYSIFSEKISRGELIIVENMKFTNYSTKEANLLIKELN